MAELELKNFDSPDETRSFPNGSVAMVTIGDTMLGRARFEPGWRWSNDVKPIAGTDSCEVSHLGYCLSGRMRVMMDDGTEGECGPGDVVAIAPGHDAEVVGDEPCVFLDFGEFGEYAKRS